jgi:ATP-dependent Clp protease adaptor protein ClpS
MSQAPSNPSEAEKGQSLQAKPTEKTKRRRRTKPKLQPLYRVLLHNDDVNEMGHVVLVIRKLTPLTLPEAVDRMLEAHHRGISLLLVVHKERAELYVEQFASCGLTVTIEPAD